MPMPGGIVADKKPELAEGGAQDLVAQVDTGARHPAGVPGKMLFGVPLAWSLFQLWYASPLPFLFGFGVFNNTEARSIHLAFAVFLAFTAFPAFRKSPRDHIPLQDWVFAALGAFSAAYIYIFYTELAGRPGSPTTFDLVIAVIGMLMLLEATRRALGPPLMIVAIVFLAYTFGGPYMPDVIAHKGQSLHKVMSHQWLTTEGVFGIALGVSTSFVFLFVLFGAMLEQAGAGNYFIKVAFAMLGHLKGGPAKAAVVASATTGLISGSSIANVATTGTFTIPLMKRVGFPGTKAGAIEVAASTNGQLTPPVMGAAAFLMIEYVGISYLEVIQHAILPAIISYIALFYIVHLEACKLNMKGLPKRHQHTIAQRLMTFAGVVSGTCVIGFFVYYGIGWIKDLAGDSAIYIVGVLVAIGILALIRTGVLGVGDAVEVVVGIGAAVLVQVSVPILGLVRAQVGAVGHPVGVGVALASPGWGGEEKEQAESEAQPGLRGQANSTGTSGTSAGKHLVVCADQAASSRTRATRTAVDSARA